MNDFLERVKAELGSFLRNPKYTPEFKHRYVLVMEAGMDTYLCRAIRRDFEVSGLQTLFTQDVMACTDSHLPDGRALIHGAMYVNNLILHALARISSGSDGEVAADVVMREVGKDYMELSTLITRLALENV